MSNIFIIVFFLTTILFNTSCAKEEISEYTVTFWAEEGIEPITFGGINIIVDNEVIGTITKTFSSKPNCGAIGTLEYISDNSTIYWSAIGKGTMGLSYGNPYWPTKKVILRKKCTKIKVGYY